jgi:hypothetical protein
MIIRHGSGSRLHNLYQNNSPYQQLPVSSNLGRSVDNASADHKCTAVELKTV